MHAIAEAVSSPQRLSQSIRRHNRGVVLRTLLREKVASRADLARLTGLTRPTISHVVASLLDDGVVIEKGVRAASGPGKPAVLLEFDHRATQVLAIDLSAPGFAAAALVTSDGTVLQRISQPVASDASLIATAGELASTLKGESEYPLLGIGVAVAMCFDACDALTATLAALTSAPVHIAVDTDLAARAEHRFGDSKDDFLLVRVGVRTSTAIVTGVAKALQHHASAARELAHTTVTVSDQPAADATPCRCQRTGCVHQAIELALSAHQPLSEADATTQRQLRIEAGARLGNALAPIVSALDLPSVVLSGSEALIDDDFCAAAESALLSITQTVFQTSRETVRRAQVADAVLRGAAALVATSEVSGF